MMSNQQRILVVDDDHEVARLMRGYLEQAGYDVIVAYDGETAVNRLKGEQPALVLLDVMLPQRSGLEIVQLMRNDSQLRHIPIIMLTARVEEIDKVLGLEMGADDYVTKPYSPREVVARVRARLRDFGQIEVVQPRLLQVGNLQMDIGRYKVRVNGRVVDLTNSEFAILQVLMERAGYVMTREELIRQALGNDYEGIDRTLDSHMRNLRRKVELLDDHKYIQTVYGVGYRLVADGETAE
jgi:two-component system alkaline phosphatase synthesis response regulator PhoP